MNLKLISVRSELDRIVIQLKIYQPPTWKAGSDLNLQIHMWPQMWPQAKIKLVIIPSESVSHVTQVEFPSGPQRPEQNVLHI